MCSTIDNHTRKAHACLRVDAARATVIVHGGVGDRRALGTALGLDQTALVVPGHAGRRRRRHGEWVAEDQVTNTRQHETIRAACVKCACEIEMARNKSAWKH